MKRIITSICIVSVLTGCILNSVTGRKQLSLVQESELQLMAVSQYSTFLSENKVLNPGSSNDTAMVNRIGTRISNPITMYYKYQGKESVTEGYTWNFNTVESKEANAWCMPGGKVVF